MGIVKERPLHAYVAKHNTGSIRVLEKNGFAVIGKEKYPSSEIGKKIEKFHFQLN